MTFLATALDRSQMPTPCLLALDVGRCYHISPDFDRATFVVRVCIVSEILCTGFGKHFKMPPFVTVEMSVLWTEHYVKYMPYLVAQECTFAVTVYCTYAHK